MSENIEEARVNPNGSVTIRYYYGRTITVPAYIMDVLFEDLLYEEANKDGKIV